MWRATVHLDALCMVVMGVMPCHVLRNVENLLELHQQTQVILGQLSNGKAIKRFSCINTVKMQVFFISREAEG